MDREDGMFENRGRGEGGNDVTLLKRRGNAKRLRGSFGRFVWAEINSAPATR